MTLLLHIFVGLLLVAACKTQEESTCPSGKYGRNCKVSCHCKNGDECNNKFKCSRCEGLFFGPPVCQTMNAAYNKTITTENQVSHTQTKVALDGFTDTCTPPGGTWFQLDLGKSHQLRAIYIFNIKANVLQQEVNIYVTDHQLIDDVIGQIPNDDLCYNYSREVPTIATGINVQTICSSADRRVGRYITMQAVNTSTSYSLCEMIAFECADYVFGNSCDSICNCKDTEEICHKITGECASGCPVGFTGQNCSIDSTTSVTVNRTTSTTTLLSTQITQSPSTSLTSILPDRERTTPRSSTRRTFSSDSTTSVTVNRTTSTTTLLSTQITQSPSTSSTSILPDRERTTPRSSTRRTFSSVLEVTIPEELIQNNIFYAGLKSDCASYYNLVSSKSGFVQHCPWNTLWFNLACRHPTSVQCANDICRFGNITSYKDGQRQSCRSHWVCENLRTNRMDCCRMGFSYSDAQHRCVPDSSCTAVCTPNFQYIGPLNNDPPIVINECIPRVYIDFKNGKLHDRSGNHVPLKPQRVRVVSSSSVNIADSENGWVAAFDGLADLKIPQFAWGYFGQNFELHMRIYASPLSNGRQVFFHNGFDGEAPIAVGLDFSEENIFGHMISTTGYKVEFTGEKQAGFLSPIDVKIGYHGRGITITVTQSGITKTTNAAISGIIRQSRAAVHIGGRAQSVNSDYQNFVGYIDSISLYLCEPNTWTPPP